MPEKIQIQWRWYLKPGRKKIFLMVFGQLDVHLDEKIQNTQHKPYKL